MLSYRRWKAELIMRCPWPKESLAGVAWRDMREWKEYYDAGRTPFQAIGLRFGYIKEEGSNVPEKAKLRVPRRSVSNRRPSRRPQRNHPSGQGTPR
jgi:hypothetical protein